MIDERERRVREIVERTTLTEEEARFALALEAGDVSGDVVWRDPETHETVRRETLKEPLPSRKP